MRLKTTFCLTVCAFNYFCFAQKSTNCQLLEALLKYDEARKVFLFDKHKEVPITFVDVNLFFKDCGFSKYYDRKIEVVNDSSYLDVASYSNIEITTLLETSKGFRMSLFYKLTNAFFTYDFRRKNNKIIVKKLRGGYF